MVYCCVAVDWLASTTWTVNVLVATVVGVPVMVPVMLLAPVMPSDNPVGREPALIDQGKLPLPPAAVMLTPAPFVPYFIPTVPFVSAPAADRKSTRLNSS